MSRPGTSVLHVGKYYPPYEGGIENHVQSLAEGLNGQYDLSVLAFNTRARTVRETVNGVPVVRAATLGRIFSTEMSPAYLTWFLRMRDVDLIHLHTPNPLGELACLGAPRRARLIITYHSDVVRQRMLGRLNRLVLHRLMRRADRIIAFTRRYMESSPVISRYPEKCSIIPHGIDLNEVEESPAVRDRARRLRREHGSRIILFVGRLVYYKGVDTLLKALAGVPGAKLLIAGDGPLRASLEELAGRLGVADRTVFMGRVSHEDKIACYRGSDFLVLPATHRSEAFGLVQVEALACGLPVISTNIDSGVPFVNRDEVTGIIVEPGDAEGLAAAMRRLLEDPDARARFSAAARRRVEEHFSREVMMRDIRALYAELLSRPSARTSEAARATVRVRS